MCPDHSRDALYAALFQGLSDSVLLFETDADGFPARIIDANQAAYETRGYTREEFLRLSVRDLNTPESIARFPAAVGELKKNGIVKAELAHIFKDGRIVPVEVSARYVYLKEKPYILSVVRDISTLRHNEQMRLALKAAKMITWERDLQTGLLTYSEDYAEFFKIPDKLSAYGNTDDAILAVHPEDRSHVLGAIEQAVVQKSHFEVEFRGPSSLSSRDGEPWFLATGKVYCDSQGEPIRVMGVTMDITHRKLNQLEIVRLLDQEKVLRREAESVNRSKDMFLAMLSHELRTPLTTILTWAQMIKGQRLDHEKTLKGIQVIEQSALSQAQLINDLLDVSRMIAGKLTVENRPLCPVELIDMVIDSFSIAAGTKKIEIKRELSADGLSIVADPERLKQVLWNIIGNAIKFTPQGGRVAITLKRSEKETAELSISDTGIGIDADFLPHIFERFTQADSCSSTHSFGGLGLGLAIAGNLVRLMGGTIVARSEGRGKGSTFTVTLPTPENKV